jgi:hypothetical protein
MKDYADQFGGVRQFRVRQTAINRLEFHIAADREFSDESRQWLERRARAKFGNEMIIEFFVHERLDRTAAGKLRDFETELDVQQHLIASYHGPHAVTFDSAR